MSAGNGAGRGMRNDELLALIAEERAQRENANALIAEWMDQQRKMYEEVVSRQMQMMEDFLSVHSRTLEGLRGSSDAAMLERDMSPAGASFEGRTLKVPQPKSELTEAQPPPPHAEEEPQLRDAAAGATKCAEVEEAPAAAGAEEEDAEHGAAEGALDIGDVLEELQKREDMMNWWRRTSGMQTVEKWVENYKKHPAGWGALLMIHGIPEVTGRLRSKVENYAIYSALFLSMSIALLTEPPESMTTWAEDLPSHEKIWNHIRMRIYLYGFAIGTAAHMLSILLAMAFVNALNEAARDCDVYRMFSRGKGFLATVRCQITFRVGCVADFLAVVMAVSHHLGWETFGGTVVMLGICIYQYKYWSGLLFRSASIVRYWREELGGKPDKGDPYDLKLPLSFFQECSGLNHHFFAEGAPELALPSIAQKKEHKDSTKAHRPVHAATVAALF